ncbi:MAG: 3'(2'),5'-bisphosphate nucleotidase CysQ [Rhodospirillales bacterium]|nr:3'(2'),5'-bisphosphate nucleotidase CysQ [Rhodospirillales bacterium]
MTDLELAKIIAEGAGKILLDLRATGLFEGKALGKAGDRVANEFIMTALRENRPDDAILSEEEKDSAARLSAERVWIVDPLDGTREYGEGRADWAVHIALSIGGKPAIGAVALPGVGQVFLSEPQDLPALPQKLRVLVSRTRPAKEALAVAEALNAELVPMGSAGAKAMAVLRGEADIYLHTGGQYEWDNCAPAAVALAAGLHATRANGSPLAYNNADPYLPDLLICQKELAPKVLEALAKVPA